MHLLVKVHEKFGCHLKKVGKPGLTKSKVIELVPDIVIDEKNEALIDE